MFHPFPLIHALLIGGTLMSPPPTGLRLATPEELRAVPLASVPYSGVNLPSQVDLSPDMPPPGYQGKQNSCVGWVTAYALKSYQERIEQNRTLTLHGRPNYNHVFSPAFIYNQINQRRDGGGSFVDALNILSSRGAVSWTDMPYRVDNYTRQPSHDLLKKARLYRINFWRQVNVLDAKELKAHLNAGYPVMIGAVVDDGFYHARSGYIWRNKEGASRGGHAMLLVGYDDRKKAFKVMNSWGRIWSDKGFGWIDYGYFSKVVHEGFVAKDAWNGLPLPGSREAAKPNERMKLSGGEALHDDLVVSPVTRDEKKPDAPKKTIKKTGGKALVKGQLTAIKSKPKPKFKSSPKSEVPSKPKPAVGLNDLESLMSPSALNKQVSRFRLTIQSTRQTKTHLVLNGSVTIPNELGHSARVMVQIRPLSPLVQSLKKLNPLFQQYSLLGRYQIALSQDFELKGKGLNTLWSAKVPLKALAKSKGFQLSPTLFVDQFGVYEGKKRTYTLKP